MARQEHKGLYTRTVEEVVNWKQSPYIAGMVTGAKAALVGAPVGSLIAAIKDSNAKRGAILGALVAGVPGFAAGFAKQRIQNIDQEASIRYFADHIKEREPRFFTPERQALIKGHQAHVYRKNT